MSRYSIEGGGRKEASEQSGFPIVLALLTERLNTLDVLTSLDITLFFGSNQTRPLASHVWDLDCEDAWVRAAIEALALTFSFSVSVSGDACV